MAWYFYVRFGWGWYQKVSEITVDGELSFELPNPKSFWGTVILDSYVDDGFYTVEDNEGVINQCCHDRLHLWVNFTITVGGVSNDKHTQSSLPTVFYRKINHTVGRLFGKKKARGCGER